MGRSSGESSSAMGAILSHRGRVILPERAMEDTARVAGSSVLRKIPRKHVFCL
ncbi:MAG: hypothetical protein QM784_31420 [Polyangiaceae bacterium]